MSHSFTQLYYHVVLVTKYRTRWISRTVERIVWKVLRTECEKLGGKVYNIRGIEDHVHIVVGIPPTIPVSTFVGRVKGAASYQFSRTLPSLATFRWQTGYYANTVSRNALPTVCAYVARQRAHHTKQRPRPPHRRRGPRTPRA